MAEDEDDFTYTEDASGAQKKVSVEKEFIFKVVVLGDYSVGKTSLIKRLLAVHSLAPSNALLDEDASDMEDSDEDDALMAAVTPTVGTDFYSLALPQVLPGASLRLQIWDTAGLEKYAAKYENTFRNASFVLCVFDVTSATSLHNIVDRHLSTAAEHIPELDQSNIMVVANKIDIIADVENNTTALRDARKRAQSPETAFEDGPEDDTATNTEFFTSVKGIERDAIVTAKNVQAGVFDLFGDVHYAEVSAKTRQNVRAMLRTLAFALLRNSPEVNGTVEIPETESTYEVFAHTVLPMQTPGNTPVRKAAPAAPTSNTKTQQPSTPPPPPSLLPPPRHQDKHDNGNEKNEGVAIPRRSSPSPPPSAASPTSAAPKPSWGASGAFKFDMTPMHLSSTGVFSPIEGPDDRIDSTRNSIMSDTIPSASAATVAAPRSNAGSRSSAIKPDDVLVEVQPTKSVKPPPRDPNETPQARKEREQAEMNALLGRAGQRKAGQRGEEAASPATTASPAMGGSADAPYSDVDRMENDVAADGARLGENRTRASPSPLPTSILDTLGKREENKKPGGRADDNEDRQSDGDEDGVQMHAHLKDRFAQIEHDIKQDNAVARERAKKEKKAKGKCQMCILM